MSNQVNPRQFNTGDVWIHSLLPMLQRLDRLIEQAVAVTETIAATAGDPYRGLHIDVDQVVQWLKDEPGIPAFSNPGEHIEEPIANQFAEQPEAAALQIAQQCPPWHWLQQRLDLSGFELDVMTLALAPELDRRYERIYAYLQNDVRYRHPCVDLALNLLCASATEKLNRRHHFAPNAPLVRSGVLRLVPDPHQAEPSLLSHVLKLDEQIVRFLLGQRGLDPRLTSCAQWIEPDPTRDLPLLRKKQVQAVLNLVAVRLTDQSLYLYFVGTQELEKRQVAIALAQAIDRPLLSVNLVGLLEPRDRFETRLSILLQAVWLHDAVLYVEQFDSLHSPELEFIGHRFLATLAETNSIVILSGSQSWQVSHAVPQGIITLPFPCPGVAERRVYWQVALTRAGVHLDEVELQQLSDRFQLGPTQIADAVTAAGNQVRSSAATGSLDANGLDISLSPPPTLQDVLIALRSQFNHQLSTLTQKVDSPSNWSDLILPIDSFTQLQEICNQFKYRHRVYREWGFAQKLGAGQGINVLFSGSPGTGKTMAAGVIANELQLDLYKIDLSRVVSKYIGETEKNLDRIFRAAESAQAILLFDEADALFGKRSEVRDAHDRFANIEVGYLLQKMEEYEGIAILTTNLRQNLDEAFTRRLSFIVHFPAPDQACRRGIWQSVWAASVPLAADVDLDFLARQLKLNGGNIKNIALAATFLAARTNGPVTMVHLLHATRREYQKMGQVLSEGEWKVNPLAEFD
jgi:hypothetical protein